MCGRAAGRGCVMQCCGVTAWVVKSRNDRRRSREVRSSFHSRRIYTKLRIVPPKAELVDAQAAQGQDCVDEVVSVREAANAKLSSRVHHPTPEGFSVV